MSSATTPIHDVRDEPPRGARPSSRPMGMALPFDLNLLLAVAGLCVISLLTIDHATAGDVDGQPHYYLYRQALYMGVGAVVLVIVSRLDYSRLREIKWPIYGFLIVSMLAVSVLGADDRGSKRAINTPIAQIQASELGKVLLALFLAAFLVDRVRDISDRQTTARAMLLALVPASIVMAEDLGSGLVFLAVTFAVMLIAGTSGRQLTGLLALGAASVAIVLVVAPKVGVDILKPYQTDRLTSFLRPSDNPAQAGYQQNQSRIAIGSGEKTGRGDGATQTKFKFLPENHTDFIFAVVGERWGFVGAALVLSLYALLIWRGLRILTMSKNLYGALVAGGLLAMILFQVFINVGMNVGIMPITGIPLPLFSYGGSSVLSTFLAVGLLQSIYVQGRASAATKGRIQAP